MNIGMYLFPFASLCVPFPVGILDEHLPEGLGFQLFLPERHILRPGAIGNPQASASAPGHQHRVPRFHQFGQDAPAFPLHDGARGHRNFQGRGARGVRPFRGLDLILPLGSLGTRGGISPGSMFGLELGSMVQMEERLAGGVAVQDHVPAVFPRTGCRVGEPYLWRG